MGCFSSDTSVQAPAIKGPSAEELEIQREWLEVYKKDRELTPEEKKVQEYALKILEDQINALPMQQEEREWAHELVKKQYEYYTSDAYGEKQALDAALTQWQLEGVQQARELGAVTGDLSEQEMTALDEIEANAIQTLEETLDRDVTNKIMPSVMSEMVDRGVLQGDVGAQAISNVLERKQEILAEGTRDFSSQKTAAILGMGEAQKARQLQTQQMLMQGGISAQAGAQQWAQGALTTTAGQQQYMGNWAQQAQQFGSGMAQQWDQSKLSAGLAGWGQMADMRSQEANRALQAAIATSQGNASKSASQWGALGNMAGMGFGGYMSRPPAK